MHRSRGAEVGLVRLDRQAVGPRIAGQALDHRRAALRGGDPGAGRGQRQAEVADPGEEVEQPGLAEMRREPVERGADHPAVDLVVGLEEVPGLDAEGQFAGRPRHPACERRPGRQPVEARRLAAQPAGQMHALGRGEGLPAAGVRRVVAQLAHQQHHAAVALEQLEMADLARRLQLGELPVQGASRASRAGTSTVQRSISTRR